jgi:hypothetical protein
MNNFCNFHWNKTSNTHQKINILTFYQILTRQVYGSSNMGQISIIPIAGIIYCCTHIKKCQINCHQKCFVFCIPSFSQSISGFICFLLNYIWVYCSICWQILIRLTVIFVKNHLFRPQEHLRFRLISWLLFYIFSPNQHYVTAGTNYV